MTSKIHRVPSAFSLPSRRSVAWGGTLLLALLALALRLADVTLAAAACLVLAALLVPVHALVRAQRRARSHAAILRDQTGAIARLEPDGRVTFVNPAFCELAGRPAVELLGRRWQELGLHEDAAQLTDLLQRLTPQTPTLSLERRLPEPAAAARRTPRWMQWMLRGVFEGQQLREVLSECHEITQRKGLEEGMARSTQELARLYDRAPCAYVSLDTHGNITRANATTLAWLAAAHTGRLGKARFAEYLAAESRQRLNQTMQSLRPGVDPAPLDVQLRGQQAEQRWVRLSLACEWLANGQRVAVHLAMFDISRQREAERALHRVNAEQRAILDSDVLCLLRIRGQAIVWASAGAAAMFGYSREVLSGSSTRVLFPSDGQFVEFSALAYPAIRAGGSFHTELALVRADGGQLWVESRAVAFDSLGDETLWLYTDIGARREAEAALRASQSFLARTGSVAGVGGFQIELASGSVQWTEETCRLYEVDAATVLTLEQFLAFHAPEGRAVIEQAVQDGQRFGIAWDLELPMLAASGRRFWARTVATAEYLDGRVHRLVGATQDITERRRMEHELTTSRELLQVTLDSIGDAVITTGPEGSVTWLNPVAEQLTGWHQALALGRPLGEVYRAIDEDSRAPLGDPVARCLSEGKIVGLSGRSLLLARGRREYAVEDSIAPIRDQDAAVIGTVLVFRDVSEQRRMAREVAHRATHDALTGLANRADFEVRLAELLAVRERNGGEHAVMYLDLDQFKLLNDSCGHLVGDQILRQIAAMFRYTLRSQDVVARLGGDEFGVILADCDLAQARRLGEQICARMEGYRFHFEGRRFRVGASIGLVAVDGRWRNATALLEAADLACYAAKEAGRNRVWLWREQDRANVRHRVMLSWSTRLEQALENDGFVLHVQPVLPLRQGERRRDWEVLVRLREANGRLCMPGGFLPPAQRFHLLARIDLWVTRAVLARLRAGTGPWQSGERISINIAGQSISDPAFQTDLMQLLADAPDAAGRLCFEFAEEAVLADLESARTLAASLRACGAQVAIDDFGASAAALTWVGEFPLDRLKVARQLCAVLPGTALDQVVLRACVAVAEVLGVPAVAKGIETEAQLQSARALGFSQGQGWWLAASEPLAGASAVDDNPQTGIVLPTA